MTTRCKSCGQPVAYAITDNGRRMPLDANLDGSPVVDPKGNVIAGRTESSIGSAPVLYVTVAGVDPDPDLPRHRSHFGTCPDASKHRNPRR